MLLISKGWLGDHKKLNGKRENRRNGEKDPSLNMRERGREGRDKKKKAKREKRGKKKRTGCTGARCNKRQKK